MSLTIYEYKLMVRYNDDHFEDGDTEQFYIHGYSSIYQRTHEEIQSVFKNCEVLHAHLEHIKVGTNITSLKKIM